MKPQLLLLSCIALTGCVPSLVGAPCSSNDNCPGGQTCVSGACAAGSAAGSATGGGMGGGGAGGGGGTGGGGGVTGGGTGGGGGGGGGGGSPDGGAVLPQTYEFNSAGARMTGGTVTLDLELGHPTLRTKMTGGTLEVTGSAAVQR